MLDKLCNLFCGSPKADETVDALREVLSSDGVGIVSARCCAPLASQNDEALEANLAKAMDRVGREASSYRVISITEAQKALPKLKDQLAPAQQRLISQIQGMVSTQGFSIFPILVIDGKVAYYGGLPTPEMIACKLTPARAALS